MQRLKRHTVSVIIPVYNGRDHVGNAIESALCQSYPAQEIIVVDDGSKDDTFAVVAKYPVRYVRQENAGPGAARNTGARLARGEWFAFLDHDDRWHPAKTEKQLEFGLDPGVGVVYCALKKIDQVPLTWDSLWARNIVGTPSGAIVRRQCFWAVGGFDCRRALIGTEDHHLWMRIALTKWRMVRCPLPLFEYAPANNSLSRQFDKMLRAEWASCEDVEQRAGLGKEVLQRKKIAIANHYIREFIGVRDMPGARKLISSIGPTNVELDLLLAAVSPSWLLSARKSVTAKLRRHTTDQPPEISGERHSQAEPGSSDAATGETPCGPLCAFTREMAERRICDERGEIRSLRT